MPNENLSGEKTQIKGYVDSRLRDLVIADADARNIPLSEAVAQALAKAYGRPDLATVPRKRLGRPIGKSEQPESAPSAKPKNRRSKKDSAS